jgi:hypothetical protein
MLLLLHLLLLPQLLLLVSMQLLLSCSPHGFGDVVSWRCCTCFYCRSFNYS